METTKICSSCRKELPVSRFSKRSGAKDGLQYKCKECHNKLQREYNKNHSEVLKGVSERYYRKHRDEVLARAKRMYHRNVKKNKG